MVADKGVALENIQTAETGLIDSRSSVIERASIIMDAFGAGPERWLLSDLTEYTGLPRSTVFRLITQLVDVGWLERDHDRQGYRLGKRMIAVGERYGQHGDLREASHPVLNKLHAATGMFVHLAVLEKGGTIHYLDKHGSIPGVKFPSRVGFRYPIEHTSSGKAMLANMRTEAAEDIIATREQLGHVDLGWVRKELNVIRRNFGVAVINGGVKWTRTRSAGAAILGPNGPVGAISVGAFDVAVQPVFPHVLAAAQQVSNKLFPEWNEERKRAQRSSSRNRFVA